MIACVVKLFEHKHIYIFQPKQYGKVRHHWEIARRDIRLTELKAKGSYVEVWRGRMRKFPNKREIMKIAIKKIVGKWYKSL